MSDERTSRVHRRGFIAVVGASAIAGCNTLDGVFEGDDRTIRAYDLPDIDEESVPNPVIPESVPVDISSAHLHSGRDRVTGLLARLPTPFGPEQIPNGHIRQHLTEAAGDAADRLTEARNARTPLLALQAVRHAREQARYAAAGWAVAEEGLSAATLQREHRQASSTTRNVRERYEYTGTDPVRASIVHARIETNLDRATDRTRWPGEESDLLTVAEWGQRAESTQAHLDDARHLAAQFSGSLPDDAGTVEPTLRAAAETLLAAVRARQSALPPEPTAADWGIEADLLATSRREADDGPTRVTDAIGPANAVIGATDQLSKGRAVDRIAARIDAGEISSVDRAEDVRTARETVYDALDTALEASRSTDLARTVLSNVSWRVTSADRELARARGEVSSGQLDDIVSEYYLVTAIARATPAACRQTIDALGT